MLGESRGAEVIEELRKLRDSGEYPTLREDIQGEIDYFTAKQRNARTEQRPPPAESA